MAEETTPQTTQETTQETTSPAEEKTTGNNNDIATVLKEVKEAHNKEIETIRADYEKKIAERNNVIKQLMTGEGNANSTDPVSDCLDKINAKRSRLAKW